MVTRDQLKEAAQRALKNANGDRQLAAARYERWVLANPARILALIDYKPEVTRCSKEMIAEVAASAPVPEEARLELPRPTNSAERATGHVPNRAAAFPPVSAEPSSSAAAPPKVPERAGARLPQADESTRRGASVVARIVAGQVARSVLDSFKVPDGRAIGDVRWCELETIRRDSAQMASVVRQLQRHGVPATPDAYVRDVVKASALERYVQLAAEVADAA